VPVAIGRRMARTASDPVVSVLTPGRARETGGQGQNTAPGVVAEVESYTSMDLSVDQITGLRDVLAIKRTTRQFTGI
jgi:hypothetical protein